MYFDPSVRRDIASIGANQFCVEQPRDALVGSPRHGTSYSGLRALTMPTTIAPLPSELLDVWG